MELVHLACADAVFFLGEHHDGAAFGRFVRKRRQLRRIGQFLFAHAADRPEGRRLTVAERDRAGLVEQERIDVAGRLDGASGHGEHVEAHQAVHAGDADGGQKRADRRRNKRHEQRHQGDDRDGAARVSGEARDRRDGDDEDQRQAGEQDVEGDLVRRLLTRRALDQRDHAVDEGRARRCRDPHADPVRQHLRAARHRRAVAAGFADDRSGFTGDRGLVDGSHALDHLAIARDDVARLDEDEVAHLELRVPG